jgi:hypothetical protein
LWGTPRDCISRLIGWGDAWGMRRDSENAGLEAFLCTFWALYKIATSLHQVADALKRKGHHYTAWRALPRVISAERAGTGVKSARARKGSQRYEGLNWNAHRHTVLHRHFLWRFPTVERPPAKLPPSAEISLARVPSWPSPPSRNARPHGHRIVRQITCHVPPRVVVTMVLTDKP